LPDPTAGRCRGADHRR